MFLASPGRRLLCRNAGRTRLPQRIVPSSRVLAVHLAGTAGPGARAASLQRAPLNQSKINFQSQQASQLPTEGFSPRSHCLSPAPQMKAGIVGGCRRAALPGGPFQVLSHRLLKPPHWSIVRKRCSAAPRALGFWQRPGFNKGAQSNFAEVKQSI